MTAVRGSGPTPSDARLTVILVHGRGATPDDILGLAHEIGQNDISYLAPAAPGGTWYPYSFLAPIAQNEPSLSAALATIDRLIRELTQQRVPPDRVALVGFSQGACLSLEYAARHARRYAAVVGFSGGLIGPPGTPRDYDGSLSGTPVFLGCSDIDPHIPLERVGESAEVLKTIGGAVDARIYPGMGHTINRDEIEAASILLRA
jgi:predicted esterase